MRALMFVVRVVSLTLAWGFALLGLTSLAHGACFGSDVRAVCCPAACGARWTLRDDVLRGCMTGLGCASSATATASSVCGCSR